MPKKGTPNEPGSPHGKAACRTSAGIAWRSWWSRPRNKGLTFSCSFHILLCFTLTFVTLAAPRLSGDAEPITAAFAPPDARLVQFELNPVDLIGGGGGPTPSADEFDTPDPAVGLGSGAESHIALPVMPEAPIAGLNPGPGEGRGRGTGQGDGTGLLKPAGKNAVMEGSFTVWTIPDDPIPGETYKIMIEVRLPAKVSRYPRSDLSGMVTGTDGWHQPLPGDATPQLPYLPVHNHTVQLQVEVPGAARRIRDTIELRSKLLKEDQVLKIVF
jgi:hypothetical protein